MGKAEGAASEPIKALLLHLGMNMWSDRDVPGALGPPTGAVGRAGPLHQALRLPVTASAGSASRLTFLAVSGSLAAELDHMSAGNRVWAQTKPLVG